MNTFALITLLLSPSAFAGHRVSVTAEVRGWNALFLCDTDEDTKKTYELAAVRPRLQKQADDVCAPESARLDESSLILGGSCGGRRGPGTQPVFTISASAAFRCGDQ